MTNGQSRRSVVVLHVPCLIPCRTWHWPQAQVLSHLPHQSFRHSHQHTRDLWYTIHIYPAKFHGRVADQHKSYRSQVMSPRRLRPKPSRPKRSSLKTSSPEELRLGGDPYQIQERFMRNNCQNPIAEDVDEFGKVGAEMSTSSLPIMTQRKALQTPILKMENYEKFWLHHCTYRVEWIVNHLEYQLLRGNLLQRYRRSKCKAYWSWSPEKRKLDVKFVSRTESMWETRCNVFIREQGTRKPTQEFYFKHADPLNLGRSLLEGNEDLLLSQASSDLTKQEHQVGSLNNCISELQQQAYAQRLELQDARWISTRTSSSIWKTYLWRKKFSELLRSEVCTKWEKRRELKNYELSKSQCKNKEKIITRHYRSSLASCSTCKSRWILWMIQENSRSGIKLQWDIVLRFQSICNDSMFSFHAEPRQTPAFWDKGYIGITGKRFW